MKNEQGTELAKVLWYYNLLPEKDALNPKIVCPFHNDVNPSVLVNLNEGNWYCFGCGRSGDAKKFVKLMEKCNDLQAYQKFLRILKSDKCKGITIEGTQKRTRAPRRDLYNEAYDYYHGLAKINWRHSGDSEEVLNAKQYMKARGFGPRTLTKCGCKVTYNNAYGLIFPMMDNGTFKGWVCRTMLKEIEKKRKYLYNEGFSRATTLVGDYGSEDWVIVVEGYMDRLKFIQFGVDNVVAILGWKMSQEQEKKLKDKGIVHVISALDNDECGKKGTKYLRTRFKQVTRFKYLKGIKDPGDMTQETFDKMFSRTMQQLGISNQKKRSK